MGCFLQLPAFISMLLLFFYRPPVLPMGVFHMDFSFPIFIVDITSVKNLPKTDLFVNYIIITNLEGGFMKSFARSPQFSHFPSLVVSADEDEMSHVNEGSD